MSYPPPPGGYGAPAPGSPYGPGPDGQPFGAPAPQPQQPSPSRRPLLLAALAGFLVAAVIAGVLVAAGVFDDSDSDGGTSTSAISLPSKVDSFVAFADAKANQTDRAKNALANASEVEKKTAQSLTDAYDGAGSAVRSYVSDDLEVQFQIWAVRAHVAPPVVPYQDADYLGLAQPTTVVRKYGDTYCQLYAVEQTPKGKTPAADSYTATACVRSDDDLSVIYTGGGASTFSRNPARVAKVVDEIWDELS